MRPCSRLASGWARASARALFLVCGSAGVKRKDNDALGPDAVGPGVVGYQKPVGHPV